MSLGVSELIIIFVPCALGIWAFIDILTSEFISSTDKIIWLLVVVFIPVLGFVLYFTYGRKQRVSAKD